MYAQIQNTTQRLNNETQKKKHEQRGTENNINITIYKLQQETQTVANEQDSNVS